MGALLSDDEFLGAKSAGAVMSDSDFLGKPRADPKLNVNAEPTFAEKYIAPLISNIAMTHGIDLGNLAGGNVRGSAVGRIAQGAADPGVAIVQAGANAASTVNKALGNGGPADDTLANKVNQAIKEHEQQYQAARTGAGSTGFDPLRMVGNIAVTAPLAGAGGAAETLLGQIGKGALTGAGMAELEPVTDGGQNYWTEKGKQGVVGAIGGGVAAPLVGAAARIISPNASVNPKLLALRNEGVNETSIGQTLGGVANSIEEKAQSLPIVGSMIRQARERGGQQAIDAAFDRAASPIGATIEGRGSAGIGELEGKLGAEYERVLPKLSANVTDPTFVDRMASLRGMVQGLPKQEADQFDAVISREIDGRLSPNGTLQGQNLKDAWNALRDNAKQFSTSTDAYQQKLGTAFKQAFQELKDHVASSNSAENVQALRNTDLGYANFKRLQRAASSVGADDGDFTISQLHGAVKALDKSKDKGQFAKGEALMQDLTGPAKSVLANKVPDSGTAGRIGLGALLSGGALATGQVVPAAAGLGVGALAYTRPVQNALRALVMNRPDAAPQVANKLRELLLGRQVPVRYLGAPSPQGQ